LPFPGSRIWKFFPVKPVVLFFLYFIFYDERIAKLGGLERSTRHERKLLRANISRDFAINGNLAHGRRAGKKNKKKNSGFTGGGETGPFAREVDTLVLVSFLASQVVTRPRENEPKRCPLRVFPPGPRA